MIATMTGGALAAYIALPLVALVLLAGAVLFWVNRHDSYEGGLWRVCAAICVICIPLWLGAWWWGMAFTTSADYHAWNVKQGKVENVGKRLIASGDSGMSERYVFTIAGVPYGVDDTRASVVKPGDAVTLRCKKDYQWGVPREAHGWACRWNGAAR